MEIGVLFELLLRQLQTFSESYHDVSINSKSHLFMIFISVLVCVFGMMIRKSHAGDSGSV